MPKPAGKPARSMAESGSAVERAGDLSPSANGASRVRLHRRRPELDDADRQLIALLTASGRMSTRALAAEVDLTEPTVAARLRKLADLRILGVTATLDWAAAGYRWDAWLQVSVHGRSVKEVGAQLARVESVDRVHVVFGAYDLLVHLLLSDESEAVAAIEERIGAIEGVHSIRPAVTLQTVKFQTLHARIPIRPIPLTFPNPVIDLDPLDLALIDALVADGRQSNREVGRQLGVSEGTVRLRLRRMEEAGLVRITARSDPYLTGEVNAWATIEIATEQGTSRAVARQLADMPETTTVTLVAGAYDIVASVATASRSRLVDLALEEIRSIPGVRSTVTSEMVSTLNLSSQWARLLAD